MQPSVLIKVLICVMAYRIWRHLADLTTSGQSTVIITTHYIEEAKMAHAVTTCCEFVYKL